MITLTAGARAHRTELPPCLIDFQLQMQHGDGRSLPHPGLQTSDAGKAPHTRHTRRPPSSRLPRNQAAHASVARDSSRHAGLTHINMPLEAVVSRPHTPPVLSVSVCFVRNVAVRGGARGVDLAVRHDLPSHQPHVSPRGVHMVS